MTDLTKFPEPSSEHSDPAELSRLYLDFYRRELVRRIRGIGEDAVRRSHVPSGWTPIEMLSHLVHMEQRWFVWGFLGRQVDEPLGDESAGTWHVPEDVTAEDLLIRLHSGAAITDDILNTYPLEAKAQPGGRFTDELPNLMWICFHVLQEYARHLGHLDVAVELEGGPTGPAR